ncbi:ArsR/SmtB family transcription factor [Nonomuraea sp. NPDC050536]|uniref:ArsR/SmtB family transcription factor n=1 Tax=Nonomuraea sp. NPDC050536 TaxID=3364366 RepID=UPI0037CB5C65
MEEIAPDPIDHAIKAISELRRRAILKLVAHQELPAGRIAEHFEVTRPAISQHLQGLKEAGLVIERREGTKRLYRARHEGLAPLRQFLDEMWAESLDFARRIAEGERGLSDDRAEAG